VAEGENSPEGINSEEMSDGEQMHDLERYIWFKLIIAMVIKSTTAVHWSVR